MKPMAELVETAAAEFPIQVSAEALDARNRETADFARRQKNLRVAQLRATWGAPARHAGKLPVEVVKSQWTEKLKELTRRLENTPGSMLGFVGNRGTGKTQMAVELMRQATAAERSALFTSAIGFFLKIKASFAKDAKQTELEVLGEFFRPHLLVIDEIGKRGDSAWEDNLLFELLNRRYNAMKDTVIISNMPKGEFEDYIKDSLTSRINETGGLVEFNWASFRQ